MSIDAAKRILAEVQPHISDAVQAAYNTGAMEARKQHAAARDEYMAQADELVKRAQVDAARLLELSNRNLAKAGFGHCGSCKDWTEESVGGWGRCGSFNRSYDAGAVGDRMQTRRVFGCTHFRKIEPPVLSPNTKSAAKAKKRST